MHRSLSDLPAVGTPLSSILLLVLTINRPKMVRLCRLSPWEWESSPCPKDWNGAFVSSVQNRRSNEIHRSLLARNAKRPSERMPQSSMSLTNTVHTAIITLLLMLLPRNPCWRLKARMLESIVGCWRTIAYGKRNCGLYLMSRRHQINWAEAEAE